MNTYKLHENVKLKKDIVNNNNDILEKKGEIAEIIAFYKNNIIITTKNNSYTINSTFIAPLKKEKHYQIATVKFINFSTNIEYKYKLYDDLDINIGDIVIVEGYKIAKIINLENPVYGDGSYLFKEVMGKCDISMYKKRHSKQCLTY